MSNKYRFEEIKMQIKELLEEAIDLVPEHAKPRSKSYWYSQIAVALDETHSWLGGSMCSMQDTLEEFEDADEEDYDHDASRPTHMRDEDWD